MATAAQIAANRRNSLLSCGPKTASGKEMARSNSLKHGLTGAGVVLLPEDREKFERRREEWAKGIDAEDGRRAFLADRAALASVRLDRCVTIETARLADRAREAERLFDRRERRRARTLGARLAGDPAAVLDRLRGFAAGCRWMIERLDGIDAKLAATGPLDEPSRAEGRLLLAEEFAWLLDLADDPEGRATLREAIAVTRADLVEDRDRLAAEVEGPARERARTLALFDPSDEAARLAKYEAGHESMLHRTFKVLDRRPAVREVSPGETRPVVVQNEANSAPAAPLRFVPRPAPRPARNEPKDRGRRFLSMLLLGLIAGLLLGPGGEGPERAKSLWDRAFGLVVGIQEGPPTGARPDAAGPSFAREGIVEGVTSPHSRTVESDAIR